MRERSPDASPKPRSPARPQAKDEFARASRKLASEFDAAPRASPGRPRQGPRSKAIAEFESRREAGRLESPTARRPQADRRRHPADRVEEGPGSPACSKITAISASPIPPPSPRQIRGSHKVENPLDKVFDRLQKLEPSLALLEGLVIPKSMKGRNGSSGSSSILLAGTRSSRLILLRSARQVGLPVAIGLVIGRRPRLPAQDPALQALGDPGQQILSIRISQALIDSEAMVKRRPRLGR